MTTEDALIATALAALSAALIAWAKSQPDPARIHTSPVSVDVTA